MINDSVIDWNVESMRYNRFHKRMLFIAKLVNRYFGHESVNLLDIGCSGGKLRRILNSNFRYYGLDIVDVRAQQKFPFLLWNLDQDPVEEVIEVFNTSFNCVSLGGVFEYIDNFENSIHKLLPLLRRSSDSLIVFSYSNKYFLPYSFKVLTSRDHRWIKNLVHVDILLNYFSKSGFSPYSIHMGILGLFYIPLNRFTRMFRFFSNVYVCALTKSR